MTLSREERISTQLQNIRALYMRDLPNKIGNLQHSWQGYCRTREDQERHHLRIQIHSLAGSAGSFGLSELQQLAEQLEKIILTDDPCDPTVAQHTQALLAKMLHQAEQAEQATQPYVSSGRQQLPTVQKHHILIVEDDPDQGDDIVLQLEHYGYEVTLLRQIEQLPDKISRHRIDLILCDVMHDHRQDAGFQAIANINQERHRHTPVLFLSVRDDLDARLQAIRAGGIGYFPKPVNMGELIDRIEQLLSPPAIERRPHILIVDDDATLSQYHALLLEEAGMQTWVLNDPDNLLDTMRLFNPDIVIMDLYFPDCTGVELAAVIRQKKDYLGIPILFLSIEKEISEHLLAYTIGADDFLTKPIHPQHFVPLIEQKVRRFRQLRNLMLHDSLTGAYNHTSIKNMLDNEAARARRELRNLVAVMLDVDHFKLVNDTYGHPAGDRVLRDLAHLLHRRLRHTDYVGRYGGEEFLLILGDTSLETATRLVDTMRRHFAEIVHEEGDRQFRATFSAGIAQFSDYDNTNLLISAADEALYRAKENGRNRIEIQRPQHQEDSKT